MAALPKHVSAPRHSPAASDSFNPQKYYISIKSPKNVAFLKVRRKRVRFVAMLPEARVRGIGKAHTVASLSQGVQDFYNGPCAAGDISDTSNFKEIEELIRELLTHEPDNGHPIAGR